MIDTPVFGFFHRARALPAEMHRPPINNAAADFTHVEHEANAPASHLPEPVFPRYGQAPHHASLASIPQQALQSPSACDHSAIPAQRPAAAMAFTKGRVTANALDADQLGLAHPLAITLFARLEGAEIYELDASASGIYRPSGCRPAPWSGFAYDEAPNASIGLAAGTRILTARGEIEVERLLPGDTALALRGPALLPIAWIGRTVTAEHSVCIDAGALGPNLPRRTLCVAAGQPIFLQAMPVAARTLLNGSTIRPAEREGVDMFHVDVGKAEILFAEGLPLSSGERTRQQRSAVQPLP